MTVTLSHAPHPVKTDAPGPEIPDAGPTGLTGRLLAWYERHARDLPWRLGPAARRRGQRPDPYRVWLAEVMLQQTTVKAVLPYYAAFLQRWPSFAELAAAPDGDVLAAWAGLGYYARARSLISCARAVAARPDARFPETAAALAGLPGIGAYTSASVAALAFGEPVAVVDGNVERVVTRLFAITTPLPRAKHIVRSRLQALVPAERPAEFAEAVMDLGATICTPRRPACALCPWTQACEARRRGEQELFPVKAARRERPLRHGFAYVARRQDGAILLRRRAARGLLGGMSEPPGSPWECVAPADLPPFAAAWEEVDRPVTQGFTHFELSLAVRRALISDQRAAPEGMWWAAAGTLYQEALPNVMKKVIEAAWPDATKPARG